MTRNEFANEFASEKDRRPDDHEALLERTREKLLDAASNGSSEENTLTEEETAVTIEAMFGKQEELHPDLVPWIEESDSLGTCIKHPLVFSIMHHDQLNATINQGYVQKKRMHDEYREEKNWYALVFAVFERAYRLYAFGTITGDVGDEDYWHILGAIWTDSENIWQCEDEWLEYLSAERPLREHLMDGEERTALAALPEEIIIYRGFEQDGRENGLSWSLEKERAHWFARRLHIPDKGHTPRVATATVRKEDVLAHFTGRGEAEIVALPEHVNITDIEEAT